MRRVLRDPGFFLRAKGNMSVCFQGIPFFADVSAEEPVCRHLAKKVLPKEGIEVRFPDFERVPLNQERTVYCYRERRSGFCLVCKLFGNRSGLSPLHRRNLLHHEFSSLQNLRRMGFYRHPYCAVRPIDKNERCGCVLVEDLARGHDLDHFIRKMAHEGGHEELKKRIVLLAGFLARLHRKGSQDRSVDFSTLSKYFRRIRQAVAMAVS